MAKFVLYGRVSTDEQGAEGYSLDDQIETGHRLANGGDIVSVYREIESGTNDERPLLKQAVADCRKHGARLVVAKLDRLARSLRFLLKLIEDDLGNDNIPLMGDLPNITNDAAGLFMLHIMAANAQFEVGRIRERTRIGVRRAKLAGKQCGWAKAPEAAQKLAQRLVAEGHGLRATARALASAGFLSPSNRVYEANSIKRMLAA